MPQRHPDSRPGLRCLLVRRAASLVAVAALFAAGGCATLPSAPRAPELALVPADSRAARNLRVFDRVWSLVAGDYYDAGFHGQDWTTAAVTYGREAAAAPDPAALYHAINGMLGTLHDGHTHALTPDETKDRRAHERARVGLGLARLEGRWVVEAVVPGSPAEAAGVQTGWLALARNGAPLGERLDMHSREGETARWEFLDARDRPISFDLTARLISTAPYREVRVLAGGILYLRFDEFAYDSRRWLHTQLKEHRDAPALVLDLRENPGGGAFWMREMAGEFFDEKINLGRFIARNGAADSTRSWQFASVRYRGPVAVVVGGASASATEIFTDALQREHRAVVIGRKTAGIVLLSRFYRLPDGGALQLSIEDYRTPTGLHLEGRGVEPDVSVSHTLADVRAGRDADLEAAVRELQRHSANPGS